MGEDDLVYLLRRAAEERVRAADAQALHARAAHQALADAYERRVRERQGDRRADAV